MLLVGPDRYDDPQTKQARLGRIALRAADCCRFNDVDPAWASRLPGLSKGGFHGVSSMTIPNRSRRAGSRRLASTPTPRRTQLGVIDDELTPAQIRELDRRLADHCDPTRYMLASQMTRRFAFYYNVTDDVYATDPRGGTLFKRRQTALAVKALLHPGIEVLACTSKRVDGISVPILSSARSRRPTVKPLLSSSKHRGRRSGRRASRR